MKLTDPLTVLPGIGEVLAQKFANLGVNTLAELINYYPRRYDDYSKISPIGGLKPGPVSFKAVVKNVKGRRGQKGLYITEAIASDPSGSVRLIWFNQSYRDKYFKDSQAYYVSGNYELSRNHFTIINPSTEVVSDLPTNTARILAVYPETKGLNSQQIRKAVVQILPLIARAKESLPDSILKDRNLLGRAEALTALHRPNTSAELDSAKRRLGFEEVFEFALASLINKQENQKEVALKIKFNQKLAKSFVESLPFQLTDAQRLAIWRICQDMERSIPMNRLVEGDVGSGKTVVAVMVALMVLAAHKQVAVMAPTEILARQHAETVYKLLEPLGLSGQVGLLVGSLPPKQKTTAYQAIADHRSNLIIGTHALIQDKLELNDLGLVVVDEQHRFGVKQRQALLAKAGHMPHLLSLSATPIPRSLALTLYGELAITRLAEKPIGRQPVITKIIYTSQLKDLYTQIDQEIENGHQAFIVCPNIKDSAATGAKSAEAVYNDLAKTAFKHRRLGLLHGQLKAEAKQQVMNSFVQGKLDILVATTVIEVGVDVPNATVMVIMSPDRFGLAQLHQLRGRIGRGEGQGHFYLLMDNNEAPLKRLRALEQYSDGFKLAELDLSLRGPGAIYGTYQHGALDLRIANLSDRQLINEAVKSAQTFLDRHDDLAKYSILNQRIKRLRAVTNLN